MLATRYLQNPIITTEQVPFRVNSIFNPGAVKYKDEYILICRTELPSGRSVFVLARSFDGVQFTVDEKPWMTPQDHNEFCKYVEWGIEDARVVKINDRYYMTYTGYSKHMPLVMLAETKDFTDFHIHGPISEPSNKDCALFPAQINGLYWRMDRPSAEHRRDIWLSHSSDLIHWGGYRFLAEPESGTWESDKIGGSTPPIRTDEGWLLLYHGVRGFGISSLYKLGAMLLDLDEPWKVIGKTTYPLLTPEHDYERVGDVNNVVFCNGWIPEDDGELKLYYSGADTNICLATLQIDDAIAACKGLK
jgi:predicted GH43/DUF377 family glycosyl hydrolase